MLRLTEKKIALTIKELDAGFGRIRDLSVSIGKLSSGDWVEPEGPTPYPSLATLRSWDRKLLSRYQPFYMPFCDLCCMCTFGKCDLTGTKKGACGITMPAQQARTVLMTACIGAATHTSHARELVTYAIKRAGRDCIIEPGGNAIGVEAPIIRLVCGEKPQTLADLETVLDYCESQITSLLAATHTGQEGDPLDFESKVLHAGMIDQVGMEVADLAQIAALGYPKADPDAPLAALGMGTVETTKPVILVIGHNVPPSVAIIDYLSRENMTDQVEVTGICCTSIDASRYSPRAKIIGPMSWQLRYIRSGIPDVIVVDEQCVRTDAFSEASLVGTPFIATSDKNCMGLPDRTDDPADAIVADLSTGLQKGVLILDPEKAGEVAVRVARAVMPARRKSLASANPALISEKAAECTQCQLCRRACPNDLAIPQAMKAAGDGDLSFLSAIYDICVGCGRCEHTCVKKIPVHSLIVSAAADKIKKERYVIRTGRGAIQDVEIRNVGGPIVLGEIPGVVAFVGCSNFANGGKEIAEMAVEFAKRRYIVVTSGCAAMSIGMYRDEEGKTPYERFPGSFTAGGIVNVGSCVANAHIAGATIKIASIFARRNLRGNYAEIADYVHNRVGAVGVAWGAMSQKAAAIASGFWRLGIPVVVGPHGTKYRRMLLGRADHDEDWYVCYQRTGEEVYAGPAPEHLFVAAETKEEAMVLIAKLCMRPNDTSRGRAMKLSHYIDLYQRHNGVMPDDIPRYIRTMSDIPVTLKGDVSRILLKSAWKERPIPDPTLFRHSKPISPEER
ncbi:MAG: CO dehydrogenase/acetyl-CoA synthase complex subunit alpha [Methanoregula sp.]